MPGWYRSVTTHEAHDAAPVPEEVPGSQMEQSQNPSCRSARVLLSARYEPAGQSVHSVLAMPGANFPAGHVSQGERPDPEYLPAAQGGLAVGTAVGAEVGIPVGTVVGMLVAMYRA